MKPLQNNDNDDGDVDDDDNDTDYDTITATYNDSHNDGCKVKRKYVGLSLPLMLSGLKHRSLSVWAMDFHIFDSMYHFKMTSTKPW